METKANPNPDYGCYAKAMPDEPMFVLLGRDPAAPAAIRRWVKYRRQLADQDPAQLEQAEQDAEAFARWREENLGAWRDYQPPATADLIPTPSDEISSIAGRVMSSEYGVTSDVVVAELIEKIAGANSGAEAVEAAKSVLGPFEDAAQKLAGFVMRSDREAGPSADG